MNKEKNESRRSDPNNLYQLSANFLASRRASVLPARPRFAAAAKPNIVRWWANIGWPRKVGASLPPIA